MKILSRFGCVALMAACVASPALGQSNKNQPSKPTSVPSNTGKKPTNPQQATPASQPEGGQPIKAPGGGTGATISFAPEPFRMDPVGLTMRLPEGCKAQSTTAGDRATTQITPADSSWILNIQIPRTSDPKATVTEAADKTITLIQGSFGVLDADQKTIMETKAKVLERDDKLMLPGGAASRFYINVPGNDKAHIVKGYTIFKPSTMQFVVFELIAGEAEFKKVKGVYETIIATAQFTDSDAMMTERAMYIKAGTKFFGELTEADYLQAMKGEKTWQRLYKPAATGAPGDATELGYRGIRFWKGKRGEVDPDKPRNTWSKEEQEDGFLCSVEGRFVIYGATGSATDVVDSRGVYFMRPDRTEETWSIRTVYTDATGKQVSAATDTGARVGSDLTVVMKQTGKPISTLSPANISEGYMSKFETQLLPRLLVRHKLQTTIGSYAWSDQERLLSFRKDEVTRESNKGGAYVIKTSFREEAVSQTYTYNEKGDFLKGEIEGLGIWEPTDPAALMRLWKQKNLPTDK